tara:strand:+ start:371 stop:613 length:243 start_codon:yes stop_codon:yes gene_type:complete
MKDNRTNKEMHQADYMKDNRTKKEIHLNLKITNRMFMLIDTIRSHYLIENERLPSRSEVVRLLLEEALHFRDQNRTDLPI